jgi:fatty acyl-CoA reductase
MGSYPSTGPLKQPPCCLPKQEVQILGPEISVKKAFSKAGVFITGATGYVGSVVVEQLLRLVPDIAAIYILVRPKRGKTGA